MRLFGPHPLSFAFAARALLAKKRVLLGVRQDFPEYMSVPALGRPCGSVAYPYGDVDDRVNKAARAAGYAAGAALPAVPHRASPFQLPRVGVHHGDCPARFRLKVSPLVRRARVALGR